MDNLAVKLQELLEEYSQYNGNVIKDLIEKSPFSFLLCQSLFVKISQNGEIDEIERNFIIDYMRSGLMNKEEILDYEDLRIKYPKIDLPVVDF